MQDKETQKWVHLIGIAGVTMAPIAKMYLDKGWRVSGSDENIYDSPAKEILDQNSIKYYLEFSYKNLVDGDRMPDLVILGASKSVKNKELLFAEKQNLKVVSYPEVLAEEVMLPNHSLVVTGTYGKTTITSLLIHIFLSAGIDISYMVGGFSDSLKQTLNPKNENTAFSIIEGDEYISSKIDPRSKFFFYNPNILIINSIEWDHTDFFKTEAQYVENFRELASSLPADAIIFANRSKNMSKALKGIKRNVVWFSEGKYKVKTKMIGAFNRENAAFANQIARTMGLDRKLVENAILEFSGIKRRLEVRFQNKSVSIIDDFGSSPAKAKGALKTLRKEFPKSKIILVFEPNEGARTKQSLDLYRGAFDGAAKIFLPEFREMKDRIDAEGLNFQLKKCGYNSHYVQKDNLTQTILDEFSKKTVVAFLGSHSFENEIQELIQNLKN